MGHLYNLKCQNALFECQNLIFIHLTLNSHLNSVKSIVKKSFWLMWSLLGVMWCDHIAHIRPKSAHISTTKQNAQQNSLKMSLIFNHRIFVQNLVLIGLPYIEI